MSNNPNQLAPKFWNYCNILRDDGLSYGDYVEQLTFLLFLKMVDEQSRPPFNKRRAVRKRHGWSSLAGKLERRLSVVEDLGTVGWANLQRAVRFPQSILERAFTGRLA